MEYYLERLTDYYYSRLTVYDSVWCQFKIVSLFYTMGDSAMRLIVRMNSWAWWYYVKREVYTILQDLML